MFVLKVSKEREGKAVDGRCHALTASYVREQHQYNENVPVCDFFENFENSGRDQVVPAGAYSIDDLKEYSRKRGFCPYFLARQAVSPQRFF